MQAMNAGDLELEHRFDSYARARLSPNPQAAARIRSHVMREARLDHEAARIAAHMAPAMTHRPRSRFRRLAMPGLAATIWLGIAVGSIAAAHAGGPLYPTRLWLESAVLPGGGVTRVDAELRRLKDRESEAVSAANNGDGRGVAAALTAYADIAEDASAAGAGDPEQLARVQQALGNHVDVLTAVAAGLADSGNDTAAGSIEQNIERAIEHNAAVIANLAERVGKPAGAVNSGAGTSVEDPNGQGVNGGTGAGPANGGAQQAPPAGGGGKGSPGAGPTAGGGAGGAGGGSTTGGNGKGQPTPPAATLAPAPSADPKHTPRPKGS